MASQPSRPIDQLTVDERKFFDTLNGVIDDNGHNPFKIDCLNITTTNENGVDWLTDYYYCKATVSCKTSQATISAVRSPTSQDIYDHIILTHVVTFAPLDSDKLQNDEDTQQFKSGWMQQGGGPQKQFHPVFPDAYRVRIRYIPRDTLIYPWSQCFKLQLSPWFGNFVILDADPNEDLSWAPQAKAAKQRSGPWPVPIPTECPVAVEGSNPTETQTHTGYTKGVSTSISGNIGFFDTSLTGGLSIGETFSSSTSYDVPSVTIHDQGGNEYIDKIIRLNSDNQKSGDLQMTFEEMFSITDDKYGTRSVLNKDASDPISTRVFELHIWAGMEVNGQLVWNPYGPEYKKRYYLKVPAPPLPSGAKPAPPLPDSAIQPFYPDRDDYFRTVEAAKYWPKPPQIDPKTGMFIVSN